MKKNFGNLKRISFRHTLVGMVLVATIGVHAQTGTLAPAVAPAMAVGGGMGITSGAVEGGLVPASPPSVTGVGAMPALLPDRSGIGAAKVVPGARANPIARESKALDIAKDGDIRAPKSGGENQEEAQLKDQTTKSLAPSQNAFQKFVTQNTGQSLPLFGYDLFSQPEKYAPVLAAPVPSSYVLGPGDELVLQTYGLMDVAERLVIDRDGRVSLPKVGTVLLAGIPFGEAERVLNANLSKVYTNYTLSLTMGRLRSMEIFVLGQAARPGKHVVNGLSTLINAMFETGGSSSNGSLRQIELRRGGKSITVVDLYKFIAHGDNNTDARLQSGDVIFIPPAGERAAVLGTVHSPAIYELRNGETIADILALSGGLPVLAAPQKAQLERLNAKEILARYVEDFALDEQGLKRALKAGDVLSVFQISPQIANVVTLEGNVAAPMRYNLKPGMRVSDILTDPRLLIPSSYWLGVNRGANSNSPNRPEVNLDYATIQRFDPQSLTTRLLSFSPLKAVQGDAKENFDLLSGDIVSIYAPGQAGPETEDSISVRGEIVGGLKRFPWRKGMTFKEIIPSTQWLIDYYQYWQKSSGKDIRNDINWDYAQVTRRNPKTLLTDSFEFNLGQQVMGEVNSTSFKPLVLQPGDQVSLFTTAQVQVPIENRIQFVTVSGEIKVPGVYQLRPGETLPQLIARAGGLTRNAYLYGTIFTRESTRVRQQANLEVAVRRMEVDLGSQSEKIALAGATSSTDSQLLQVQLAGQRQQVNRLRALRASGRITLEIEPDKLHLPDLILENDDTINVPNNSNFVGVYGSVLAETSFIYKTGLTLGDYIERAGPTREAELEATLLVRADGTVKSNPAVRSWWGWGNMGFMGSKIYPGDSIFVPEVVDRRTVYNQFIQGAKDWTQLLYQFGLGAAAFNTLKN